MPMDSPVISWEAMAERGASLWTWPARFAIWPLQTALLYPSVLYLGALSIFLFRPPDVDFYHADRIAFVVVAGAVLSRALFLRQRLPWVPGISWPMLALVVLAAARALRDPFAVQTWSLVADKFIVPFTMFHLAILVFSAAPARRQFQVFVIAVLAYLIFTAIAFLIGANSLIFPGFIRDENLGLHADRARGPFLQAVANGLALNLLGILAVVFAENRRKLVIALWLALPFAILATLTRAVCIAFAASTFALVLRFGNRRLRRACFTIALAGVSLCAGAMLGSSDLRKTLLERTSEQGPVSARMSVYEAGWTMFQDHPLSGWKASQMYPELARRMQGYHLRAFYPHNTYLSLLLEFGIPGLALYAFLFVRLLRLSSRPADVAANAPRITADQVVENRRRETMVSLRAVWPILLGVYLFNAFFVDMAYQFVIGLMFTVAGILCATPETEA